MKKLFPFLLCFSMIFSSHFLIASGDSETGETIVQFSKVESGKNMNAFAFPNPLTINSIISYELSRDSKVVLSLFDCQGRLIKQLLDEKQQAGNQKYFMERSELAAGLYFLNIKADDQVVSISIAVVD